MSNNKNIVSEKNRVAELPIETVGLGNGGQECPHVLTFYDKGTNTLTYIVKDPLSQSCAIVDSVLNFDYASGSITYHSADNIIEYVRNESLQVELLLETHVHADHLSAAPYLQQELGGKIAISKHIVEIQNEFGKLFNEGTEFERDGSQFDVLFDENQTFAIGNLQCVAMYTPGHTPACTTYVVGDAAFVGDTLFMPDSGTARVDFPGGDASTLYQSIKKILSLPPHTRLFVCHDYQPNGRELAFETSVEEQLARNIHVKTSIEEQEFIAMRESRDKTLNMPRLILPSLQVNMRAGHFPDPEENQTHYLKVPLSGLNNKDKNSNY